MEKKGALFFLTFGGGDSDLMDNENDLGNDSDNNFGVDLSPYMGI